MRTKKRVSARKVVRSITKAKLQVLTSPTEQLETSHGGGSASLVMGSTKLVAARKKLLMADVLRSAKVSIYSTPIGSESGVGNGQFRAPTSGRSLNVSVGSQIGDVNVRAHSSGESSIPSRRVGSESLANEVEREYVRVPPVIIVEDSSSHTPDAHIAIPVTHIANPAHLEDGNGVDIGNLDRNNEQEKEILMKVDGGEKKVQSSFFVDNRKAGKSLNLNFVPSEKEAVVVLDDGKWSEGVEQWKTSLVRHVM